MIASDENFDVVIIGAGPAGSLAAAMLAQRGIKVLMLEKTRFPRFVIGESLLPQSMAYLEKAGLLKAVEAASFQVKNGANFSDDSHFSSIDFKDKFTAGWATAYQVPRDQFDLLLAKEAERTGAILRFENAVSAVAFKGAEVHLAGMGPKGAFRIRCRFVVDASGYGRVLPRLLKLNRPSSFPVRHAFFTHVEDKLEQKKFDRQKILITVHPRQGDIWYWLIPFANGRSSVGVVVPEAVMAGRQGSPSDILWKLIGETSELRALLADASECRTVGELHGYSSNVSKICGTNFALLGNAGEFLDPVFSSGVTIAFKSADLLIEPLLRQLAGEDVHWEQEFAVPLKIGVDCFRAFVDAWYDGDLQNIIFNASKHDNAIKKMIVSILAGYAWDEKNPFVKQGRKYLDIVAAQCT